MIDLTIIIVNWNTRQLLLDCLDAVAQDICKNAGRQIEVVVVDNASTDGSAEAVIAQHPDVRLLRNLTNTGFAAANNRGIQESDSQFVYLLNSDTVRTYAFENG